MGSEGNKNGGVEVLPWLKGLPVAPEYHPTVAEFQDPIGYIYKIEKEASRYGICKIVPPFVSSSRKTALANLNRSLIARPGSDGPTFTTRQQQIGFCPRKHNRPVQKPVWQSGERYTVQEFEAKAKGFEKNYLKRFVGKKNFNGLEMESLYWRATVDKPFSVEYANDMPGSAFSMPKEGSNASGINGSNVTVGETDWNMRGVSRAKGSLLRFMKEEIPGVTSPMVYIAMMFSWFAWHVEDHDLHSLNYLHMGAGKTWYGVPKDAAVAFEDVIRAQGYGGEVNPLVMFATLGEKTTVMSPEVLINAGIPCCRLVQNPGEFVVTFPRAYHSGFSHGFNCGEAANIATPEWLTIAKAAAIRRATINSPPMVSHFQLLYDLALSLCSRVPKNMSMEPRSSRLKDKNKAEGEILVKDLFVHDVLQNNNLLHILSKGSSVVILPRITLSKSMCSNSQGGFQSKVKARFFTGLCSPDLEVKTRTSLVSEGIMLDRSQGSKHVTGSQASSSNTGNDGDQCGRVTSQGLFSCTTCGILCFASVAMIQPTAAASQYLMSGDCSIFDDWKGATDGLAARSEDTATPGNSAAGRVQKRFPDGLFDVPVESAAQIQPDDNAVISNTEAQKDTSSLGLLALNYGNSSESEDDGGEADIPVEPCLNNPGNSSPESGYDSDTIGSDCHHPASHLDNCLNVIPLKIDESCAEYGLTEARFESRCEGSRSEEVARKKPVATVLDEDSSRIHIFCLQHAVQVERQLQAIGGAHVVLLSHPDYPELEAQAKKLAVELATEHLWRDISFREACKEDEEMIHSAMDNEEAIHGNGDWAVKLGINLCYSANLSRSPFYSKQMAYNRVLYDAYGCRTGNVTQSDRRSSGRQKKLVVAGKWCGKVWMSNQVHPLLAERVSEEQEQERDILGPVKNDLMLQRPSEGTKTAEATSTYTTYKMERKRKTSAEPRSVVNADSVDAEESEEDFEVLLVSCMQHKNNARNKGMKKDTRVKSVRNSNQLDSGTEDELEDSEVLPKSGKQHKDNHRNKRMKEDISGPQMKSVRNGKQLDLENEDEIDDNVVLRDLGKQHEDNPRKTQMLRKRNSKQLDWPSEDEREDFLVLQKSSKQHKNNLRKLQKNVRNSELDPRTEDELEGSEVLPKTGKQRTDNLRNKRNRKETPEPQTRSVRNSTEDELEDSEVGPITGMQRTDNHRNKRNKKETPEPQTRIVRNSNQLDSRTEDELEGGPSTRLRKRTAKPIKGSGTKSVVKPDLKVQAKSSKAKKVPAVKTAVSKNTRVREEAECQCDLDGCSMSFSSKQELTLHKKNICPVRGCGKKFFSHKYLVQHRRVHLDARPLKCPWKGCKMTFKWAWARTEHIRVHTGDRPYVCAEAGCGQTFRFVSDFSRHKRKTGHTARKVSSHTAKKVRR